MSETFDHKKIEKKWQDEWEKSKIYQAKDDSKKDKFYQLETFPYPSAAGLHVGHPKGYIAEDIHARFMRANGKEVMYTMGWDAFGLPTENYAIKIGRSPKLVAADNIANFKRQVKMFGLSYDWDREINTSSPEYYKWTQWLFIQLFNAGLAYRKKAKVNWCPKDQTVLANEQVVNGKCERCGELVIQKEMEQWFFKITDYAERLLNDLEGLDWPEPTVQMQKNWIGKSEGAEIDFLIDESQKVKRFVLLHGKGGSPSRNFFPWLKLELEKLGMEVQVPELPNTSEPNDEEQADFVQKNCQIDEQTVVIGHSFGGIVALRLIERGFKANGVILVGTPYSGKFLDDKPRPTVIAAVGKGFDFEKIKKNVSYFEVLSDINDYVIPVADGEAFAEKLGILLNKIKAEEGHFCAQEEPSILEAAIPRIKVFTTRPDTIFGATYMVLAPEHALVQSLASSIENFDEVQKYIEATKKKTELQRTALEKDKTGVELKGVKAINPANGESIPVWIADYVLSTYGTGAIMAVPAHDERDLEFAKKFNLPIVDKPFVPMDEAIKKYGTAKTQYKLRDWSVSRQRYWGVPIPMIHCEKCGIVPVPQKDLPVELPDDVDFRPQGMPPLASSDKFINAKCPNCGEAAKRDPETLDTFVDSSWYYMRYTDPKNSKAFADKKKLEHWMPVDLYVIGAEHTVLHLLYSRFISKFLYDQKLVNFKEPFLKLRHQGLIQGADGQKMSKSRGNVVNPDEVVAEVGADSLRVYEMFMGPFEDGQPWNTKGLIGARRFLEKVWRFQQEYQEGLDNKEIHKLVKKITSDIPNLKFNTAIATFMEFLNENKQLSKANWETFLVLLAPFAPHITEELWQMLGHKDSIHTQAWPKFDESKTKDEIVTVVVQVLGRVRASMEVNAGLDQQAIRDLALKDAKVIKHLEGKEIVKEIFVKDKLINFVIK